MNQEITNYLKSLGMGEILIEKIGTYYNNFYRIYGETMDDAVISEYINEDGQRQYESLFFFSENHVFEVSNFLLAESKMWISCLNGNISYLGFTHKDFDYIAPTASSRLNVDTKWKQGTSFILNIKASGNNCLHLLNIVQKYMNRALA